MQKPHTGEKREFHIVTKEKQLIDHIYFFSCLQPIKYPTVMSFDAINIMLKEN